MIPNSCSCIRLDQHIPPTVKHNTGSHSLTWPITPALMHCNCLQHHEVCLPTNPCMLYRKCVELIFTQLLLTTVTWSHVVLWIFTVILSGIDWHFTVINCWVNKRNQKFKWNDLCFHICTLCEYLFIFWSCVLLNNHLCMDRH